MILNSLQMMLLHRETQQKQAFYHVFFTCKQSEF